MCVCACLHVEPISRSKDYVRSQMKIASVVGLCTPVLTSVPEIDGIRYSKVRAAAVRLAELTSF